MLRTQLIVLAILVASVARAQTTQPVEGFDKVEFHNNANNGMRRDFRGLARGYMTAAWWSPAQMKDNRVAWWTAAVPAKAPTKFSFIAATCVLPMEFSRGPQAKLTVNGHEAITFTLGMNRDYTWKQGDYQLKYISKRLEYPYFNSWRQYDVNGNSGIFELTVPEGAIEEGKAALIEVSIPPNDRWNNGWFMVKNRRDVLAESTIETLKGEVEALRQDMAVVVEQNEILATQIYKNLLGGEQFQQQTIYSNGYRHLHPADIIRLKNGELLLFSREGTEHISNDGDVLMLRSKDGGKTWGDKQMIATIKDLDEREGCGLQLKDGTIVVGVFYNDLYDANGVYKGPATRPASKHARLGAYTIASKDDGHTWSEPRYVETKGMPFTNLEGPTDAPIEMPDGSILMAVIGYALNGEADNLAAVMLQSTDQGATWKYLSTIAADPGGKLGGFMEPGIVRTKTGRIVAAMRNHAEENAIWTTWSDDDGKTWRPPQQTKMIGHPTDLIQLADGRVMATYGLRPMHARPGGIRACFSADNGETWDVRTEVQLRNDFLNLDVGYPESIEMSEGRVLTVYYFNLFGKYFLGATWWTPPAAYP